MKNLLTLLLLIIGPTGIWAQGLLGGYVNNVRVTNAVHLGYPDGQLAGSETVCGMYVGPVGGPLALVSAPVPFAAGRAEIEDRAIPGAPSGTAVMMQFRAWPASYPNYEAAIVDGTRATPVGVSQIFRLTLVENIGINVGIAPFWISPVPEVRLLSQWPGFARGTPADLEVVGRYAYVALGGSGLVVLDIINPAHPVRAASCVTPAPAMAVRVVNDFAYVATAGAGLQVVDVTDPTRPQWIGGVPTHGPAWDVDVVGDYAFVVDFAGDMFVFDIRNPGNPVQAARYRDLFEPFGIQVTNQIAYVAANYTGLQLIDVSSPANPRHLSEHLLSQVQAVHVVGSRAYVGYGQGLAVIDVSHPTNLVSLGTHTIIGGANRVQVVGNYAYVATRDAGVLILDVGDPSHIVRAGSYPEWVTCLQVQGDNAYLGSGENGVELFDASTPTNLIRTGSCELSGNAQGVTVSGNHAFVGDSLAGLKVFDVSDWAAPVLLGSLKFGVDVLALEVVSNIAYVATPSGGLRVVDVSDPAHPFQRAIYPGICLGVQVIGGHAFLASGDSGLEVVDVSDPDSPVHVGRYNTPGYAKRLHVVGNYAYLADGTAGLQVIDITDPAHPTWVGGFDTSGYALDVRVEGDHACVADSYGGLQILNVSDPAQPAAVGSYATADSASGVWCSDSRVYLAAGTNGLVVLDISNPSTPVWLGSCNTMGEARAVWATSHRAYVADGSGGLAVVGLGVPQTIQFSALRDRLVTDSPFDLDAIATSLLPVRFRIVSGPAVVDRKTVTLSGSGRVTVLAEQPGDELYLPACFERSFWSLSPIAMAIGCEPDGPVTIRVHGNAGIPLRIETTTRLPASSWDWAPWITTTSATMPCVLVDTNPPVPQRFYRARQP